MSGKYRWDVKQRGLLHASIHSGGVLCLARAPIPLDSLPRQEKTLVDNYPYRCPGKVLQACAHYLYCCDRERIGDKAAEAHRLVDEIRVEFIDELG